jgi:hypothetical protein
MRIFISLLLLVVLLSVGAARAGELEGFMGLNSTSYDNSSDANTWGASLRLQYNFTPEDSSWILNMNAPGISLLASQLRGGYLWRSHGDFFWEGGLSIGYGLIFGADFTLTGGFGYRVTKRFFFDFPAYLGSTLAVYPMFGLEF